MGGRIGSNWRLQAFETGSEDFMTGGVEQAATVLRPEAVGCSRVDRVVVMLPLSSRRSAADWPFRTESARLAYQLPGPHAHGAALHRSIAPQRLCCFAVCLYSKKEDYAKGRKPIARGNEILRQRDPFVGSVAPELVLCCSGPGRCIASPSCGFSSGHSATSSC